MGILTKAVLVVSLSQSSGIAIHHIPQTTMETCKQSMVDYVAEMAPMENVVIANRTDKSIRGKSTAWQMYTYFYIRCLER